MSNTLLDEYKAYYDVRSGKYAGNPKFENYYQAEKKLSDAMQSCNALEEFRDKIGDLNERCAIALTRDRNLMEKAHFEKHQEIIRKKLSEAILSRLDECRVVNEVITMVNEESNKNSIEISLDEAHQFFVWEWEMLDLIDVYSNAEVPSKYRSSMQERAQEIRKSIAEGEATLTRDMQRYRQDWKPDPRMMKEYRHRRLLPYSDEQIDEHIAKYKSLLNL